MKDAAAIAAWLRAALGQRLGVPPDAIDPAARFRSYGVDSNMATGLLAELGATLDRPLSPVLAWDHPTVATLAAAIEAIPAGGSTAATSGRGHDERAGNGHRMPAAPVAGPIAIVGMACRFPGADDPDALWRLLADGTDMIREVPPERWSLARFYDPQPDTPGRMSTRWGGFLDQVDAFDAAFFGISPREAAQTDPQQRLMLELAWEALEDAGIVVRRLAGSRTSVFAGAIWHDYATLLLRHGPTRVDSYSATGTHHSIVANRISYVLGLQGPSLSVDTACSSSLVAVHLACDALRHGDCDLALAGGVNLMLAPDGTVAMSKFGAMAPDGRCKAFDASANGYVRGEGAGLVVLKSLARALADGDRVHALILGSAVNNDGFSNGLTAPNPAAQEAVLAEACARAGVAPADIDVVETHGTGTLLGDPIEARSLGAVLGRDRPANRPLRIGSIKSNLGHTEAAAGIAGLLKAVLMLRHRAAPPSLHFVTPNPMIPFDALHLTVPTTLQLLAREGRLFAGVSSFGFGGTNAHAVLAEAPSPHVILGPKPVAQPAANRLVFVFSGQGGQWTGMGRGLLACSPAFRAAFLRCDRAVSAVAGWSLLAALTRPDGDLPAEIDRVQPMIFAVQVALAALWRDAGPRPDAVLGHSMGEVAAAVAGGHLSLADGARIICTRSTAMRRAAGAGAMLAVALPRAEAEAALADTLPGSDVSVAVENAPGAVVLSGAPDALQRLATSFQARAVECGFVRVDVASHSPQMEPLLPELAAAIADIRPLPGEVPFISAVRATQVCPAALDAAYWCDNLRQPVRFAAAVAAILATAGETHFIEIGPHPVLTGALERNLAAAGRDGLVLPSMLREADEAAAIVAAAQALRIAGREVWPRFTVDPSAAALLPLSAHNADALPALALRVANRLAHQTARSLPLREGAGGRGSYLRQPLPEGTSPPIPLPEAEGEKLNPPAFHALAAVAGQLRDHYEHRAAVIADSPSEAHRLLCAWGKAPDRPDVASGRRPLSGPFPLVLVCAGQGTQTPGMGLALAATEPVVAETLRAAEAVIQPLAGWSLAGELACGRSDARLTRTDIAQPALVALQVALARLLAEWGLRPAAVIGHSVGEIAAAAIAGALPFDAALRIAVLRGRLMQQTAGQGRMAAVELPAAALADRLAGWPALSIAAANAPDQTVVSGDTAALQTWLATLPAGVRHRDLGVDYAFHSPLMAPLRDALETALQDVAPQEGQIRLISTVTGTPLSGTAFTAAHWGANLRRTVRFADAVAAAGPAGFVELGPHPSLLRSIEAVLADRKTDGFAVATLRRGQPERRATLAAAGRLYAAGHDLDWPMLAPGWAPQAEGGAVRMPPYPWQRRRFWLPDPPAAADLPPGGGHPLIATRTDIALGPVVFESLLAPDHPAWLGDHRLHDRIVVPAAAYLETALAACRATDPSRKLALAGIEFPQAIVLAAEERRRLQAVVEGDRLSLFHRTVDGAGGWTLCMSAQRDGETKSLPLPQGEGEGSAPSPDASGWMDGAEFYAAFRARGGALGPAFQVLTRVAAADGTAWAEATLPAAARDSAPYVLHPVLLDTVLQLPNLLPIRVGTEALYVPLAIEHLWVSGTPADDSVRCTLRWPDQAVGETVRLDAAIRTRDGALVAWVRGLQVKRARPDVFGRLGAEGHAAWRHRVVHRPVALPEAPAAGPWHVLPCRTGAFADAVTGFARPVPPGCWPASGDLIDLRALDLPPGDTLQPADLVAAAATACTALARDLTGLAASGTPVRLHVVTGNAATDPLQAALAGCARSLGREHARHWGGLLEVDRAAPPTAEALLRAVSCDDDERILAGESLSASRLEQSPAAAGAIPTGPWLVTGGFGALGLLAVEVLVAAGVRRIAVLYRNPASEAAEARLAALDAELRRVPCDLRDAEAVAATVAGAQAVVGPLDGIVHAAGVRGDALSAAVTPDLASEVLAPKLGAAAALARSIAGSATRLVLFGSITGPLGAAGQALYAAANAALDAIAAGCGGTVLHWPVWDGIGMAAAGATGWAGLGLATLDSATGRQLLASGLAGGAGSHSFVSADWRALAASGAAGRSLLRSLAPAAAPAGRLRQELERLATPSARRDALEATLAEMLAVLLGFESADRLDRQRGFFDIGLDSLLAVRLRNQLQDALGLPLPQSLAFDNPNVTALSDFLLLETGLAEQQSEDQHDPLADQLEAELVRAGY
jgi:acyl transferase domain-containing protein/acyl carrier protein